MEIKRPQPNTLTVQAKVNGRAVLLVLDTGWSGHGITLDADSAGAVKTPMDNEESRA